MRQNYFYILLLLIQFSFVFSSCKEEEGGLSNADFIGEWDTSEWFVLNVDDSVDYEFNRSILYPYKAKFVTDNFNFYVFTNLIDLNSDFSYTKYFETEGENDFTVNDPNKLINGNWNFNKNTKELIFDEGTSNAISLNLLIYFNDSFTLTEELTGRADFDEDGQEEDLRLTIKTTFVKRN